MQVQKNLPRKKRRKLEAAREMLEDNEGEEEEEDEEGDEKRGRSRVSISEIHITLSLSLSLSRRDDKHCIDFKCVFFFRGKTRKNRRQIRRD